MTRSEATRQGARTFASDLVEQFPSFASMTDRDAVALRLLDTVACAVGAEKLTGDASTAVSRVAQLCAALGEGGARQATVWATGKKASVEAAALRNGVSARFLDYNDTYVSRAIVHPSDCIPILVAVAEAFRRPWSSLEQAITVMYEVLCRLADQANLRAQGFDGSSLSALGAAAGCSWLLDVAPEQAAVGMNLASLDAATLRCVRRGKLSHWKAIASARGASKGWFAVNAATAGVVGPDDAFAGADGFFANVAGDMMVDPDDREPRLPRTILKLYPAQIFIQGPVDLARRATSAPGWDRSRVSEVVIATSRQALDMVGTRLTDVAGRLNPETADHSLAFCVAAALVEGDLEPDAVHRLIADPTVLELAGRIHTVEDDEATRRFPRELVGELVVRYDDGTSRNWRSDGKPLTSPSALRKKVDMLCGSEPWKWPWELEGSAPPLELAQAHDAMEASTL